MAKVAEIADGVCRLEVFDDADRFAFAELQAVFDPSLIGGDFTPEFIANFGGIQEGLYPPSFNGDGIVGYAPRCDSGEVPPRFCGVIERDPGRKVQLDWDCVNEFLGPSNRRSGDNLGVSVTYSCYDGDGTLAIEVAAVVYDLRISPVIQNLHLLELRGLPSFSDFDLHYEEGGRIRTLSPEALFGQVRAGNAYLLHSHMPKPAYPTYTRWHDIEKNELFFQRDCGAGIPKVIGVTRCADGRGTLMVHGRLPDRSQPVQLGIYASDRGMIPMLSQFAWVGFEPRTISRFRIFVLLLDGKNNEAMARKALVLADYDNPTSVLPLG